MMNSFSRRIARKACLRILHKMGQEVKHLSSRHKLERGMVGGPVWCRGYAGRGSRSSTCQRFAHPAAIEGRLGRASLQPGQIGGKGP